MSCDYVAKYLAAFLDRGEREGFDAGVVSNHVESCRSCYDALAIYFRTIELPGSTFLRETIDELCLAIYHLAGTVIRERKDPEQNTENMVAAETPEGDESDHAETADGMIEDAEEFTGSAEVGGRDLEEIREAVTGAAVARERKLDLAVALLRQVTSFETRHLPRTFNMLGVLHLWRNEFVLAEAAFLRVIASRGEDEDGSRARCFAHCNLGYLSQLRGELPAARKHARRAIVMAEEMGEDPFFALVALLYFEILEPGRPDLRSASECLDRILAMPGGADRLRAALKMENNRPMGDALRKSGLLTPTSDLLD